MLYRNQGRNCAHPQPFSVYNLIFGKCSEQWISRIVYALGLSFFLVVIILILQPFQSVTHILLINPHEETTFVVSDKFLSFAIDSSVIANGINDYNFSKLQNLLKPLGKGYLRIGGTMADRLIFDANGSTIYKISNTNTLDGGSCAYEDLFCDPKNRLNFTMFGKEWLLLNRFTKNSGFTMLFDLNVLIRNPDGTWNSTNAEELINFSNSHHLDIAWELGNEPNSFRHVFNYEIDPFQLANDFQKLRRILTKYARYKNSLLIGPDVTRPRPKSNSEDYLSAFLRSEDNVLDAVTWHQYYFNGRTAILQYFLNPEIFNLLQEQIKIVKRIVNDNVIRKIPIWLGETSSAYGGGAPTYSNRFISTFIWLDKLGLAAKNGLDVVVRQSFINGYYALIDPDYYPNPDWWITVLYNILVDKRVLPCKYVSSDHVRLYCHCAKQINLIDIDEQAIVIYGMNLKNTEVVIRLQDSLNLDETYTIYGYILETYVTILSKFIYLNGILLKLNPDDTLPAFDPLLISNNALTLPPFSLGFWVVKNKKFSMCP